ncbi:acetyl/propionyl/methylcrotonyl-CoA carboxylase subunit alpha [Nocardioides campestrisoli]|uniref:acetyl/propionyl/methylcrotonyl-CoA carboxylase subunit alpha n=1 Tax=Nocardioides campestrisoli TaxID=2736757 RepID=UPI0015E7A651|nr:biotin carboxylase N-terminal domain-containing protein [Nocardioides campestrisoli]
MVSTSSTDGTSSTDAAGTLLIANRGEIALRIIRTASRLGWTTVAIHTDLDAKAPHVASADRAVRVGSYLDVDEVVAAAVASGAGFVHPGYGFLSERAPFARALAEAGVTLVGPSAEVMDSMGRKDRARDIAVAAGVPVVPSYGDEDDPSTFAYPVLVKAAAGGGGKGMRVVRSADEYDAARAAAAREALSSFGDDTLLVEKYVESGRHVEVQVMGDSAGRVVHLFERDCSTQRRHQKVLEEAPAPTISPEQRAAITSSAVALAAQVGYAGAGTVEFLLDNATGEFYFLEMNTRLQVEHPVTEEVVRVNGEKVDLVELQLRVATGEPLGFEQGEVTLHGHAVEARVYAEDSFGGFLPQAGRAGQVGWAGEHDWTMSWGAGEQPVVRVDHALLSGQEVSSAYDPMLGKVIAWAATREEAIDTLVRALDDTRIFGLTTNTGFLRALVDSAQFRQASIDTAWLDTDPFERGEVAAPSRDLARALAALALTGGGAEEQAAAGAVPPSTLGDPWRADGFRVAAASAPTLVQLDELVAVGDGRAGDHQATWLGGYLPHRGPSGGVGHVVAEVDGQTHRAEVVRRGDTVELVHRGQRFVFVVPDPFRDSGAAAGDGTVLAPMPGTVLEVRVAVGDRVEEGQPLGMMEAMKMELALKAPYAGTITQVEAAVGAQVPLGAPLFVVEPGEEDR